VVGGELFDRVVALQHYSEHEARDLVVILLRTLDFLHSNGIVHRDLKVRLRRVVGPHGARLPSPKSIP
jgi:serine/threonine protein kinase